tara:strand:- start:85 stop:468 length:384 start_codon:yes stop_codon:yes gene_type:complete
MAKKKETVSTLKKKLDKIFSIYIRNRDSDNGLCTCCTCGVVKPIKEMQNGHYVSRSCLPLRFAENNCHAQCMPCNIFKKGNMDEYALFMIKTYGDGILEELNQKKHQLIKYPINWYREQIEKYKNCL